MILFIHPPEAITAVWSFLRTNWKSCPILRDGAMCAKKGNFENGVRDGMLPVLPKEGFYYSTLCAD